MKLFCDSKSKMSHSNYELSNLEDFIGDQDKLENDIDDYEQNVARASFGDMVNDYERNELFFKGIKKAIQNLKLKNESPIYALDIGCGTGLLSIMAIKSGADKVLACETFKPIADCAQKIINLNGFGEKIKIIPKQSNQLMIGPNEIKPNLLVAELLDTELIGEGCLFTYRDAIKRLTSKNALYVPARARVYIQLVQSETLFHNHHFHRFNISNENVYVNVPKSVNNCFGSHILHDIQMNQLKPEKDFQLLSDPQVVFEFEFNKLDSLKLGDSKRLRIPLFKEFTEPILIFSWWEIDMDYEGEIILSCSPYWVRGMTNDKNVAWRDHWMQTIYYLPAFAFIDNDLDGFNHKMINENRNILIDCFHDSFSFWFDLPNHQNEPSPLDPSSESWNCQCGLHSHLSRTRLYSINDKLKLELYWEAFKFQTEKKFSNFDSLNFIYFGDESIVPLVLSNHHLIEQISIICQDRNCFQFFEKFLEENQHLQNKVTLCKSTDFSKTNFLNGTQINGIMSEMYFKSFNNLFPSIEYFETLRSHHSTITKQKSLENLFTFPNKIVLRCLLVEFRDFWRSFADVGNDVEGFDLSHYDDLVQNARKQADWSIEPHLVWEYPCIPLIEQTINLFEWKLNIIKNEEMTKTIEIDISHLQDRIKSPRWCEKVAVVVWLEQHLDENGKFLFSNGPQQCEPFSLNSTNLDWYRGSQQGVGFLGKDWLSKLDLFTLNLTFTYSQINKKLSFSTSKSN